MCVLCGEKLHILTLRLLTLQFVAALYLLFQADEDPHTIVVVFDPTSISKSTQTNNPIKTFDFEFVYCNEIKHTKKKRILLIGGQLNLIIDEAESILEP
jgi:hypothetical protein